MRVLLLAVLLLSVAAAFGRDDPEERVAALLTLMQGDLGRPATAGRRARLLESASVLPVMLREARASATEVEQSRRLYPLMQRGRREAATQTVNRLAARHPFRPAVPAQDPARLRAIGGRIHRQACAGCHDHPVAHAFLPAENLFRLACAQAYPLMEARLYLGVKGMAAEGHRNPFDAGERAALASWYRSGCAK